MNQISSAYKLIASHNKNIELSLYTPAHQGIPPKTECLSQEVYEYDVPFLTRHRTENVEKYFSQVYGTKHTFFLTGGGTQGDLTTCALLATRYKKVAIALNSHISTINGIVLAGLEPYFIPSQSLMPTTEEVISALENTRVSALLLTHPSYHGVILDLEKVADYCQQHDIALAIDEAHGGHLPFFDPQWRSTTGQNFPRSAIALKADIVSNSMHKYTGSLVQTALLHLPTNSRFTVDEVMGVLPLFETTTRSNILMLSLEDAINRGFSSEGKALFFQAIQECDRLRHQLDQCGTVLTYDNQVEDPLKIVLKSDRVTGAELADLLYDNGIDGEFADREGLLLIFSFNHSQQDFQFMRETLAKIVTILHDKNHKKTLPESYFCRQPQMKMLPKDAFFHQKEKLPLKEALGRISSCCIQKVPPACPLIIPGEIITEWHLDRISTDTLIDVIKE